jgi:hypothetical protein
MRITKRLIFFALLLSALPLAAQTYDWSEPGVVGVVAPGGLFSNTVSGPTLKFNSISSGTIVARYPVTNTYGAGTSSTPPWTTLWGTYTDNSSSGSVTIALYEWDKCADTYTQICSITSNDGSTTPQCDSCTFSSSTFDFDNNSYWVEVTLSRSATSAAEEIHSVAVN